MGTPLLQFGGYVFPNTFYVEKRPGNRNVPSAKLPRADGARVLVGYLEGKTFTVKGGLVGGGEIMPTAAADLRTQLDALKAALAGGPTTFQTSSDRLYQRCQASSFDETYGDTAFGRYADISFDIVTGDPFQYAVMPSMVTSTSASLTATSAGNASALPQILLTIGATGTLAATLTNSTTGEVCTLAGSVTSGQVITIDSLAQAVTIAGVDKIALFDGLFVRLQPGANTLTLAVTSATISSMTVQWQDRWY